MLAATEFENLDYSKWGEFYAGIKSYMGGHVKVMGIGKAHDLLYNSP